MSLIATFVMASALMSSLQKDSGHERTSPQLHLGAHSRCQEELKRSQELNYCPCGSAT